jgi:hypothetical protein
MQFEITTLPILFFVTLNFLILLFIKKEIDQIIASIFSYALIIIFFTITISNYNILKEIILILSCYLIGLLFIINGLNSSIEIEEKSLKKFTKFIVFPFSILGIVAVFLMIILVINNISEVSNVVEAKKLTQKNEDLFKNKDSNQENLNHELPNDKNNQIKEISVKEEKFFNISDRKRDYLKEKLSENFLLKRSSEIILLIATLPLILIFKSKKEQ